MKILCPSLRPLPRRINRSLPVSFLTGAESILALPAPTKTTSRFKRICLATSRQACSSTPPTPSPRRSPIIKGLPITAALPARAAARARPPSLLAMSITEMSTAPVAIAGTTPWSTLCLSATASALPGLPRTWSTFSWAAGSSLTSFSGNRAPLSPLTSRLGRAIPRARALALMEPTSALTAATAIRPLIESREPPSSPPVAAASTG